MAEDFGDVLFEPERVRVAADRIRSLGSILFAAAESAGYSEAELVCTCAALLKFASELGIDACQSEQN